jgi:integrase/recombinase XerD
MSKNAATPLRHRMIEDMSARQLCAATQRGHVRSCKRFAAFLNRSPDTATTEDIRRFQLHLAEAGVSICNRNRIMTGLRFLFRVTLRRLDLANEVYHIREPQKIPLVMSPDETRRLLAVASNLKVRTLLSLGYGCGLRASEVVRLKVKHIDSPQKVIRIEQSKGRKSLPSRKRGTAMSCCRRRRSTCCASGGRRARRVTMLQHRWRNAGCFRAIGRASR